MSPGTEGQLSSAAGRRVPDVAVVRLTYPLPDVLPASSVRGQSQIATFANPGTPGFATIDAAISPCGQFAGKRTKEVSAILHLLDQDESVFQAALASQSSVPLSIPPEPE